MNASPDLFLVEQPPTVDAPDRYEFVVYGTPGPQGSKKFLGTFTGKDGRQHAKMAENSKKVRPWREAVKHAALAARFDNPPIDGPIRARMVFTLAKPQSAPKRRRTWPDKTPDLSKLLRATEDALTDSGIWKDDARVVGYSRLEKVFPGEDPEALDAPGVRITIERIV